MAKSVNTPIAEMAEIIDYGSHMTSANCPFETAYVTFLLANGQKYTWTSEKAADLPSKGKVMLYAWGTENKTLKRVHVSWKNYMGMMKTTGMRNADKSLVDKLFA